MNPLKAGIISMFVAALILFLGGKKIAETLKAMKIRPLVWHILFIDFIFGALIFFMLTLSGCQPVSFDL